MQPKGRSVLNKFNKILADKKYCHEFQRTEECAKTGCYFMNIDPQKAYPSPITHNNKSNNKSVHRLKQNMIETNHQTKIEDCRTVTVLSLREISKTIF